MEVGEFALEVDVSKAVQAVLITKISTEVEGYGLQPRAVLHGGFDLFGKGRGDAGAAIRAEAATGAMLGDIERNGRKVEDLADFPVALVFRRE